MIDRETMQQIEKIANSLERIADSLSVLTQERRIYGNGYHYEKPALLAELEKISDSIHMG